MGEQHSLWTEKSFGRYGVEYRLALIVAGCAIGAIVFVGTRGMPLWEGAVAFTAVLAAGWSALLFLHGKAAEGQQRRYDSLRHARSSAERLVIYDRETGLYADWYFRLRLQEELARSHRFSQPCALLLVESTKGRLSAEHETALFACMAHTFRETDLVAHLGSLRFAVLLPKTDAAGVAIAGRRLIAKLPPGEVEIGKACYPEDGSDERALLAAAGASADHFSPGRAA